MKYKNNDLISYMFRYLEKYTGKYRVLPYYDTSLSDFPRDNTGAIDSSFDDLYIPCKKGVIKHTYDDFDKLALCIYDKRSKVAKSIFDDICKKYPNIDIFGVHPEWDWVTIQGETYGAGIQTNDYDINEHRFKAFNLITSDKGRWNTEDMCHFLEYGYGI